MKVNQNQGLNPQQTLFLDNNNDTFGIPDYESTESLLPPQSNLEPIRIEAESFDLHTYRVVDNHSASAGKIITLLGSSALETGTASYVFAGEQGEYDVILGYYDENDGQARLQVEKNDILLDDWRLDRDLPSNVGDRQTLTSRQIAAGISLQPGDTFKITGTETELEHARVDYLEFRPNHIRPNETSPIIDAGLANDTGMSATDGRTFDPTITGKIDDDGEISSLKARFDSDPHFIDVTAQVHPDGSFSLDRHQLQIINSGHPLADGHYTLDLVATDREGSTSDITPVSFILDTTPPGIHLTGLENGSTISDSSLLSGSVTEEMVMLTYRFNNGREIDVAIGDRFFAQKLDLASLHEGRNHLTLTATDKAGNVHTRTKTVHIDLLQDNEPPNLIAVLTRDTGRVMPQDTITSEVLIVGFVNDPSEVSNFQGSLAGNDVKLDLTDLIRERGRFKIDEEKLAEINGGVPLADGSYVLKLTASDSEGNVTDVVPVSFILDTTNPLITAGLANDTGINNQDNLTNDPTIAGNVADLNGFDSILVGFSTTPRSQLVDIKDLVQADGSFVLSAEQLAEINGNTSLPDGSYILHILATDIAGNSAKTLDIAFRLDTTPPQLQLTTPPNNSTIATDSQLSGKVNEAATLTYRLNNGSEIPLILDRDRQFQQDIVLALGQQTLIITATDRAGNVTTEMVNVEVANPTPTDTTPPVINASLVVDSGMDNNDRLTNEATIAGAVIDQSAIASFKAGLNNNAAGLLNVTDLLQNDASFVLDEATLTRLNSDRPLADGEYIVNLMATDVVGNESELFPVSFTLDTTPPTIDLTQPSNNMAVAADSPLVGTVDEEMVMLTYRFNDGVEVDVALQNRNFSQALDTAGLPIGENSLTLTAIDKAGNVSEETITVIVAEEDRDLVPPVISAALVTDSGIDNSDRLTNNPQITGNVSDDRQVAAVVASLGNTSLDITDLIQPNGSFVLDRTTLAKLNGDRSLADGDYTLNLIATDAAGNESEFDLAFTLDTTPPVVDVVTPAANSQVIIGTQLTGTVNEDVTSLTYRLRDGAEISFSLDRDREFVQTLDLEGVASGQQTITFTATDIAGNTSTSTVEVEIIADDGNIPVLNADLANDTGDSNSDRLTLDPTVTGQIVTTQKIDTLMGSLNGADFVDLSPALNADNTFTLALAELDLLSGGNLADGDYQIDLKATDIFGRQSELFPISFTLDRTEPPIDFDLAPDSDTGELGDSITTERVVTLIGQTEPGLTVVLVQTQQQTTADDAGNFSFTDVALASAGTAAFTVVTQDAAGNQGRSTKNITREGLNGAPTITSTPETTVDTAQSNTYTYQVSAIDPDQDPVSYTLLNAPIGAEIDAQGSLTFELPESPLPTYEFTIEANDDRGGTDTQEFQVTAIADDMQGGGENTPPIFVSNPLTSFDVALPGESSGEITPRFLNLNISPGEESNRNVSVTLPTGNDVPLNAADIVFVVDESGSMVEEQDWLINAVLDLDQKLKEQGITSTEYALVGYAGFEGITGNQAQVFNLSASANINIYGSGHNLVQSFPLDRFAEGKQELEFSLPGDGDYTVVIEAQPNGTVLDYSYDITTEVDPAFFEISQEFPLDITGTLTETETEATVNFNARKGQILLLDGLVSEDFFFRAEIIDPNGNELLSISPDDDGDPILLDISGEYTFVLDNRFGRSGTYALQILDSDDAVPISVDQEVADTISADEINLYRFSGIKGQELFVDIRSDEFNRVRLFSEDNQELFNVFTSNADARIVVPQDSSYVLAIGSTNSEVTGLEFEVVEGETIFEPLILGETIANTFSKPGQRKVYTVEVEVGQLLWFDGLAEDFSNLSAQILDANGQSFTNLTNRFSSDSDPFLITASGEIKIVIDAKDNPDDFVFRLLDFAQATPINYGEEISGVLDSTNNTTIYQFTGTKGQQLSFNDLEVSSSLRRAIYTSNGNELNFRAFTPALPEDGTYYLVTTGNTFQGETPFSFALEATDGGEIASPLNESYSGVINDINTEDTYTFEGTSGQAIYLDGLQSEGTLFLEISDPDGNRIEGIGTGNDLNPFVLPQTGSYTINIQRFSSNNEGTYNFELRDLESNLTNISFDSNVADTLALGDETQFYRFNAEKGQRLYMDVIQGSFFANWEIFGSDLESIAGRFLSDNDDLSFTIPADGEYYLRIAGNDDKPINYEFSLNILENQIIPTNLGDIFEGAISEPGQQNAHIFEASAGEIIVFNSIEADSERFDEIEFDLIAPDGSLLIEDAALDLDRPPVTAPFSGEYRLLIRAGANKTGNYKLQLAAASSVLPLNGELSNTFSALGESQVLTFTGNEGDKIIFAPPRQAFWGDANQLSEASQRLRVDRGGVEDGYLGILEALALENRAGAQQFIILVTDDDRDDTTNGSITFDGIENALFSNNINFSSITNLKLDSKDNGADGLGADNQGTVYLPDGNGGFTTDTLDNYDLEVGPFNGGIFDFDTDDTIEDYVQLTWNLNGIAWSVLEISQSGDAVDSFTTAFVEQQVAAIGDRLGVTVASSNSDITFENLTGVLEGIESGETATFEVKFTGTEDAASTELLFTQSGNDNTLFGSIPVVFNQTYFYPSLAQDADGDILTYQLASAPEDATIDSASGLITWNPDAPGEYDFTVQVDDSNGGTAIQDFVLNVGAIAQNNAAPEITSTLGITEVRAGETLNYAVTAIDPDGDTLSFYIQNAPNGVAIDPDTGVFTWTPNNTQVGEQTASIVVLDNKGGRDVQDISLTVTPGLENAAPIFVSNAPTQAISGIEYTYQPVVVDPDGDDLTYTLLENPPGMTINTDGSIAWLTNDSDLGQATVRLQVQDDRGGTTEQQFTLEVLASSEIDDTIAPELELGSSATVIQQTENLSLNIRATDNVGVQDISLAIDGEDREIPNLSLVNGTINNISLPFSTAGIFDIAVTATDFVGNSTTKTQQLRVLDPNDNQAPVIELDTSIIDPLDQVIRTPSDLVGTVSDDNLEFYRVEIAPTSLIDFDNPAAADSDYTILAQGNSNQIDTSLAKIDPSLFRNDNYFLRVVAQDFSGNLSAQGLVLGIDTPNKPGEFAQEFVDLSIPLTGVPIEITRRYSSLDANFSGDFGFGWSLGVQDAQIQESILVGDAELQGIAALFGGSDPFMFGSRVTLNTPDGRRVGFTFEPEPRPGLLGTIWQPRFTPDPGVFDTLEVDDISLTLKSDGTFGLYLFGFPYNPRDYQLTTTDGTTYNYDQFDGLQTVEDRNGNTLTYSEDGITSSTGASIEFIRDESDRITEIIDPQGQSLEYTYSAAGDLVNVSDRQSNQTTLKYEDERSHYLTEIVDPLGRSGVKTEYGEDGRISRFIDADGNALELDFGDVADFQSIADPLGNTTTLFYDDRGNVVRQVDALGGETITIYDDNNNVLTRTDAEGNTTTFTYDDNGNVLTETDALDNTTIFTYNQFAQVLTTTNALGDVATNNYDADGNLLSTIDAAGNITAYEYDLQGNLTQQTDANGDVTAYGYNALGLIANITQTLDGQNLVSTLGYDNNGNLTSITTPEGRTTLFNYDNEGRLTSATDALGNISRIEYDAAGQRTATIDALGRRTEFAYNDRGLLTQTTFADGTVEINEYDILDRLIATIDPNGNQTQFQYNALDELTGVINALNNQTTYGRDLVGNLVSQTDANGNTTAYTYDALNRLVTTELPLSQTLTNDYDAVGNLISINDFNGDILNYDYDALGQLTQVITQNNTVLETFTYTPTGQIATVTDERGLTTFEYDELDRLVKRTDPDNTFISYLYDGDDNITSLTTPGGTVGYTYDAVGFLDTVSDQGGAITDYDYDAASNLIQTIFPNDVIETRDYDLNNRVKELVTTDADGNVLASYSYTFDNLGNRLTETDNTGRITSYDYNQINQVIEVAVTDGTLGDTTTNYEYNAAGNVVKKTDSSGETSYTYDDNDRLIEESSNGQVITYSYDAAGNLIDKAINGIIVEVYNWNLQGELASAEITDGATATNTAYEYDANGIRVSQTVDGTQTNFLIDNLQQEFAQVIEEYNANSINVIYTHGLDLISQARGDNQGFYHTDSLGSTRLLTDETGSILNTYLYDAYGKILQQSEILENSYKFTGEQLDPNLESYYLRARYYNPATGRFDSRDSFAGFLERPLSLNDYLYGEGNPINAIDPSGNVAVLSYVSLATSELNEAIFAFIGAAQGFGAPSLLFIGSVLGNINAREGITDNIFEIALSETRMELSKIEEALELLSQGNNLAEAFVSGGLNASLTLTFPINIRGVNVGEASATLTITEDISGFKNGARFGIDYIKAQVGLS